MDFTLDILADGRAFRTLDIVDEYTRKRVAIVRSIGRCPACG